MPTGDKKTIPAGKNIMSRKRSPDDEVQLSYATSYNLRGPAYFKIILPDKVTGSVIGRGGQVLSDFEYRSGAQVKVSPTRTFFPTTNERMIMISGEIQQIQSILPLILSKLEEHGMDRGNMFLRIIVPANSIASIIGKGGDVIKNIQNRTGTRINIGDRIEGLPEVIVEVKGDDRQIISAVSEIIDMVQSDPRIKDLVGQYYGQNFVVGRQLETAREYQQERYTPPPSHGHTPPPPPPPVMMDPTSNPDLLMYPITIQFVVPVAAVSFIIGEDGSALAQYFRDTGATVTVDEVPVADSNDVNVSISGPLCGVQAAHIIVIKQVADALMAQPI
jgi:RNA-binding protein Nova